MVGSLGWKSFMQNGIESIAFKCGDEYGVLQHSKKVGGKGGNKTDKVHIYMLLLLSYINHAYL